MPDASIVLTKRERDQALLAAILANVPRDVALNRILPTAQAAAFGGVSPREWRRRKAAGQTPPPIKIGVKREGYRLGDLLAMNEARLVDTAK
jgi:hypothetical protein